MQILSTIFTLLISKWILIFPTMCTLMQIPENLWFSAAEAHFVQRIIGMNSWQNFILIFLNSKIIINLKFWIPAFATTIFVICVFLCIWLACQCRRADHKNKIDLIFEFFYQSKSVQFLDQLCMIALPLSQNHWLLHLFVWTRIKYTWIFFLIFIQYDKI